MRTVTLLPALVAVSLGISLAYVRPVMAYEPWADNDCDFIEWESSNVTWTIDDDLQAEERHDAVTDVLDRIASIGGQTIDFFWTDGTFHWDDGHSDINLGVGGCGSSALGCAHISYDEDILDGDCWMTEVDININSANYNMYYGVPSTKYDPNVYVDNGYTTNSNYFRVILLHEILHGVPFNHETSAGRSYNSSMLPNISANAAVWENRSPPYDLAPMPDDRRGMRWFYPTGATSERDLLIVNASIENSGQSTATMSSLCKPSGRGNDDGLNSSAFSTYCSTSQLRANRCPGDPIYYRFLLHNHGTSVESNVDPIIYLSSDTTYGAGDVALDSTAGTYNISSGTSLLVSEYGHIPVVSSGTYYLLARVAPRYSPSEDSTANNVIPLRGTITIAATCGHCAGRCGEYNDTEHCYCDESCVGYGDCCYDVCGDCEFGCGV